MEPSDDIPEVTPEEPPKRGRGRPRGSLGIKKRRALEEALLAPEPETPEEINAPPPEQDTPEKTPEVEAPEPEVSSEEEIPEPPPKRKRKPKAEPKPKPPKTPRQPKPRAPRPEPQPVDAPGGVAPLTYTQVLQQFMADTHRIRQSEKRARYDSWFSGAV